MNRRPMMLALAVLLGMSGAAGCSAAAPSSPVTGVSSASTAPTTTNAASTDAETDGSVGGQSVSCQQLTKDEVQPLLAAQIGTVDVMAAGTDDEGQECVFGADDGDGTIDILVYRGTDATAAYTDALSNEADGPVDVPGIGDKATRDTGDDEINSMKGDVFCGISLGSSGDIPGIGDLEQAASGTTDIPETANATAAQALGTLCNRIFGSGNTTPDLSSLTAGLSAAAPSTG